MYSSQAKQKQKTCWTFLLGLSKYDYLDSISIFICLNLHILESPKKFWIRPKITFHNLCLPFEPCQKSWSSPQEKHGELFYRGSSFLNIQIPSRLCADFTQILAGLKKTKTKSDCKYLDKTIYFYLNYILISCRYVLDKRGSS